MNSTCKRSPSASSRRWLDAYFKLIIRRLCCTEMSPRSLLQKPPSLSSPSSPAADTTSSSPMTATPDYPTKTSNDVSSSSSCSSRLTEVAAVTPANSELRHRVFVYGTLKYGQPNHCNFDSPTVGGRWRFVGRARSTIAFPLVIATRWNLPFLLYAPGKGETINGEVYDVDDTLLAWMDSFEGHPEVYERDQIVVQLSAVTSPGQTPDRLQPNDDASAGGPSADDINDNRVKPTNGQDTEISTDVSGDVSTLRSAPQTCSCWVYFLKRYPPGLERLKSYGTYDAFGIPGREYGPDEDLVSAENIMDELKLECDTQAIAT